MPGESYFVLVNTCHPYTPTGLCLCDEEGEVYETQAAAMKEARRLRKEHDNPAIQVWRLLPPAPRGEK